MGAAQQKQPPLATNSATPSSLAVPSSSVPPTPPVPHTAKTTASHPADAAGGPPAKVDDLFEYRKFREELFAFSLGEAAFDYSERMLKQQPNNPAVMALVAETALQYERTKNPGKRDHWIDRLDLLQRGIVLTRKCMKEYPDYGPCFTNYTILASKAAEQQHYWRIMQPVGVMSFYSTIRERGMRAVELGESPELHLALAELSARCATGEWYSWLALPRWYYKLPPKKELMEQAKFHHLRAYELDPQSVENALRLAMAYFHAGDFNESRRWYVRVRDEMPALTQKDEMWQGVAHTALCAHFDKTKWNAPLG